MIGLKVPKNRANDVRKVLLKKSIMEIDYKIKQEDNFVIIPLKNNLNNDQLESLDLSLENLVDCEFEYQKREPKSLKDYLKKKIDPQNLDEIKGSFDIIGDVVILEIPEDLESDKFKIGKAALDFTKRKTVFRKGGKVKGIKRIRELEHLAGSEISETLHREYGARFLMDVKKVYFSPRLATERHRILGMVKDGETIIDMFAGVGPLSILIALSKDVKIYSIDINPDAYNYLKKNMVINKVEDKIIPVLGDASDYLKLANILADRIIMNLPGLAYKYLDIAVDSLKEGGIIHYYEFSSDFDVALDRIKKAAHPRKFKVINKRKVRSKSPGKWHLGLDVKIL
ncbi:MAG: class I SAM-dependent methyltransferase family protein [Methanobacteriaceae archaeon]|nr:class I SAM-dependent methyltransferase family protein [Methanobacteriaceae archaeon]